MEHISVDGKEAECSIRNHDLKIRQKTGNQKEITIDFGDVLAVETNDVALNATTNQSKGTRPKWLTKIHYITRKKMVWKQTTVCVTGQTVACRAFVTELQGKFRNVCEQRPKRLLLLVNPISGGRSAKSKLKRIQPLFELGGITCDVKVSERAKHLEKIVTEYDFSTVDGIVIFGGDGSFSEVFNRLLRIAHEKAGKDYNNPEQFTPCTIPIGVIPSGTGNGVSANLYGTYDPVTAALHIIKGHSSDVPVQGAYCEDELVGYTGVLSAYGLFANIMYLTEQHRWLQRARFPIFLLYAIFIKPLRLFTAEITLTSSRNSDDCANSEDQTEIEETFSGEFSNVMLLAMNPFGQSFLNDKPGNTYVFLYRRTPGCDHMRLLRTMRRRQLPEEKDFPTISIRSVSSLRICVQTRDLGDQNPLNYLVHIDGEVFTLKKADLTIKSLQNAIRVYTSPLPRENVQTDPVVQTTTE